ncbi:VOC family protein [Nonomuraea endophytica]|uniref:VOC family protein n=1 Tax=Nonomuraea endophytica TaxID=714136 RepID=UPI0037CB6A4C
MSDTTSISSIVINSADPVALAAFYSKATGWQVTSDDADFTTLNGGAVTVSFQRVAGYQVPVWPLPGHHVHLDLAVADLDAAVKDLIALGAGRPEEQPGGGDWVVLTDPEGHPFCVMAG